MTDAVRVLIVDDSPFVCKLLAQHVRTAPFLAMAGMAHDGEAALRLAAEVRPDVIALDLEMPVMNGLEVLRRLMSDLPTPVVVVTGANRRGAMLTQAALATGAVDYLLKYEPGRDLDPAVFRAELVAKLQMAAKVKVIRSLPVQGEPSRSLGGKPLLTARSSESTSPEKRRPSLVPNFAEDLAALKGISLPPTARPAMGRTLTAGIAEHVIVIGASTGGPMAVRELLEEIPDNFPAAVLIVQHLPVAFTGVLVNQLAKTIPLPVQEAAMGEPLLPGRVYVAPGDWHLLLQPGGILEVVQGMKIRGYRPSIDVTMQSAAHVYGRRAIGVLLTGMGEDGALGMAAIRNHRGRTFAQDAASCVVYGMPKHAVEQGCVEAVGSPRQIGQWLVRTAALPMPRAVSVPESLCSNGEAHVPI